jgi:hypothetical protein
MYFKVYIFRWDTSYLVHHVIADCRKLKGVVNNNNNILYTCNNIKELDPRKAYKYLWIEESHGIEHKNEKEKLKKEYLRRLRIIYNNNNNNNSCNTVYPRNMVCFRYIIVNTLHKGDKKNNNIVICYKKYSH